MKEILYLAFVCLMLGIGGHYDYIETITSDMKANGVYYELSERYPLMSDEDLVEIYLKQKKDDEYNWN